MRGERGRSIKSGKGHPEGSVEQWDIQLGAGMVSLKHLYGSARLFTTGEVAKPPHKWLNTPVNLSS